MIYAATRSVPRMQADTRELTAIIARLMEENNALRMDRGFAPHGNKRTFSQVELEHGLSLGPTATIDDEGHVKVEFDS